MEPVTLPTDVTPQVDAPKAPATPQEQGTVVQVENQNLQTPLAEAKEHTCAPAPTPIKLLNEYEAARESTKTAKGAHAQVNNEQDATLKTAIERLDKELESFTARAQKDLTNKLNGQDASLVALRGKNTQAYNNKKGRLARQDQRLKNASASANRLANKAEGLVNKAVNALNSKAQQAQYNRYCKDATAKREAADKAQANYEKTKKANAEKLAQLKITHKEAEGKKAKEVEAKKLEIQTAHDANLKDKQEKVVAEKARLETEIQAVKKAAADVYTAQKEVKAEKFANVLEYYKGACTPAGEKWTRWGTDSEGYEVYHNAVEAKSQDVLRNYIEMTRLVANKASAQVGATTLGYVADQATQLYNITRDQRLLRPSMHARALASVEKVHNVLNTLIDKMVRYTEVKARMNERGEDNAPGTPTASDEARTVSVLLTDINAILSQNGLPGVNHQTVKVGVEGAAKAFEDVLASILGKTAQPGDDLVKAHMTARTVADTEQAKQTVASLNEKLAGYTAAKAKESDEDKTVDVLLKDINDLLKPYGLSVSHHTVEVGVKDVAKAIEDVLASILGKKEADIAPVQAEEQKSEVPVKEPVAV
tara:strand:- start:29329 stop:31110 length:1782 start_codon:yes stop_codon:yes gene_type:complete